MRNEADTFRLIKTGMDNEEGINKEEDSDIADEDWDY